MGAEAAKVALVQWSASDLAECGGDCAGPISTACSGLLRPGTTWTFEDGAGVAPNARSAALYSLSTMSMAELGVDIGPNDQVVADFLCEQLFATAAGSCDGFRMFKNAFDDGALFAGVPMDKAIGSPIAVYVRRSCANDGGEATYGGTPLGTESAASGGSTAQTYVVPVIAADRFRNVLQIQNSGTECAHVQIELKAADSCIAAVSCSSATIAAGESATVDLAACVADSFYGSAIVTASGAVAIVTDQTDDWSKLAASYEVPGYGGARSPSAQGDTVLYGPLTLSEYNGWDVAVRVGNQNASTAAKVKATFLDGGGGIITTLQDWVCPMGSQTFFMPYVAELSGRMVGSVRVESVAWAPPAPPRLSGSVLITRRDGSYGAAYPLLPAAAGFPWPDGNGQSGLGAGVGLISIPLVANSDGCTAEPCGPQVDLAVMNLVPAEGTTDYLLLFYDASGLVSTVCQRLGNLQVAYYDTGKLGHLSAGFAGGAVISATHWQHPLLDEHTGETHNVVGLAASSIERADAANNDLPSDITLGQPLLGDDAAAFATAVTAPPCPGPSNSAELLPARPSGRLAVPLLSSPSADNSCSGVLTLQNAGTDGVFAAVVTWGESAPCGDCRTPVGFWCSPNLAVGEATSFAPPADALSATVFTFAASAGRDLCAVLSERLTTDCAAYPEFALAYDTGATFAGIDMALSTAKGITGTVVRSCVDNGGESARTSGYSIEDLGVANPVTGLYGYELPWLGDNSTGLFIQNPGPVCTTVHLYAASLGECAGDREICQPMDVAPGQTIAVSAACLDVGWNIAGWMESTGPVAVVMEGDASSGHVSMFARPTWRAGIDSAVLSGSSVAYGPLSFSAFQGWESELRVVNLSPADALVSVTFDDATGMPLDRQTAWLCGQSVRNFTLPVTDYLAGDWIGQTRVESHAYIPANGGALVPPALIQANVVFEREPPAVATYPLLDGASFAWSNGAGSAGAGSGSTVIALPGSSGTSPAVGPMSSRVGVANLVPVDGHTDVAMVFIDANGVVGATCQTLAESQTSYFDFGQFGFLTPDFAGGVVISAIAWDHQQPIPGGGARNLVGLGAVSIREQSGPGDGQDPLEAFPGRPMAAAPDLGAFSIPPCAEP